MLFKVFLVEITLNLNVHQMFLPQQSTVKGSSFGTLNNKNKNYSNECCINIILGDTSVYYDFFRCLLITDVSHLWCRLARCQLPLILLIEKDHVRRK